MNIFLPPPPLPLAFLPFQLDDRPEEASDNKYCTPDATLVLITISSGLTLKIENMAKMVCPAQFYII